MLTTSVMITDISVRSSPNIGEKAKNIHKPATIAAMRLRQKLKELAELRGWSIRQVAERAKIAQQTLDSAMNGHDLRVSAAIRVARVMDVPVEWLFDDALTLAQLARRPYWLEPGVSPADKAAALRDAERAADDLVAEKHETGGGEKSSPRSKPIGAARQGAKERARRKFRGGERSTGT